jgi:transcription termination factor Rho
MYDILQLNDMLVPELLDIAEQLKISNSKKLGKQELIYKILDKQALTNSETMDKSKEDKTKKKRIVKTSTSNSTEEAFVENDAPPAEKQPRTIKKKVELAQQAPAEPEKKTERKSAKKRPIAEMPVNLPELVDNDNEPDIDVQDNNNRADTPAEGDGASQESENAATKTFNIRRQEAFNIEFDGVIQS